MLPIRIKNNKIKNMPFITQGKTNWKFLLIVMILAIVVGVGALWYAKRPEKPYQQVEIKKSETADWKTYRNEEYGFEIKYPEGVYPDFEECAKYSEIEPDVKKICFGIVRGYKLNGSVESPIIETSFIFLITPHKYASLNDYINKQEQIAEEKAIKFKIEEIRIGNEQGVKFNPILDNYNSSDSLLFKNGNIYILRELSIDRCPLGFCGIFDQMLSTFKFLE